MVIAFYYFILKGCFLWNTIKELKKFFPDEKKRDILLKLFLKVFHGKQN